MRTQALSSIARHAFERLTFPQQALHIFVEPSHRRRLGQREPDGKGRRPPRTTRGSAGDDQAKRPFTASLKY